MRNKVSRSIEAPGGGLCVDIFQRPDTSWGIEEYRRDVEDASGWFMTGYLGEVHYETEQQALNAAVNAVTWLKRTEIES